MSSRFYLKVSILLLLFLNIFTFSFAACNDNAQIILAEFSLNDNSFSHNYDGSSGIIERIELNDSTSLYQLWQTSLLNYRADKGVIYLASGGNIVDFNIDSNFNSNKYNMLIINPSNQDNFNLYLKLTLKNIGTCDNGINYMVVDSSLDKLRYYGVDNYNSVFSNLYVNPYPKWAFTGVDVDDTDSQIFEIKADNLNYNGKLYVQMGPTNTQSVFAYFWVDGSDIVCGDNLVGYGEECDDGNVLDGDGCSAICKLEYACGNGILEPNEDCDDGNLDNDDYCTSSCVRSGVCGDGIINYRYPNYVGSWRYYVNREDCDTAFNSAIYNCSDDCSTRYSTCGNSIRETSYAITNNYEQNGVDKTNTYTRYFYPQEACDGEAYCDLTCHIAYQTPIVEYLNYASNVFIGHNLTPLQNVTYQYKITNNNNEDIELYVNLRLFNYYPFTSKQYSGTHYLNYHNSNLKYEGVYSQYDNDKYYVIPANSVMYINQSVIVPNKGDEFERILTRLSLHEIIRYRPQSHVMSWQNVKNSWRNSASTGLGSYNPQYCINYLEPYNPSYTITTNLEGIPSIEIDYHKGVARAYNEKVIPSNTFFLRSQLLYEDSTIFAEKNISLNKTYHKADYSTISYNQQRSSSHPDLDVDQTISFPIYDYTLVDGEKMNFKVVPYLSKYNTTCNLQSNVYESAYMNINLDLIRMEVDNPVVLRPNGGGGYDDLYLRTVFFNYENYSLFNVSYDIEFKDMSDNVVTNLFNYTFENYTMIPAGAAYPIYVNLRYIGPHISSDQDYKMTIKIKYTIPSTGITYQKDVLVDVYLKSVNVPGSQKFVDLIPIGINYSLVNIDEESSVGVKVVNQGTKDAGSFNVKFYVRNINDNTFSLLGTKTIDSLDAGDFVLINFSFVPNYLEKYVLKVVVDEENNVFEDNSLVDGAKENNVITSITMVRDIDVILEYVYPVLEDAQNGVIPFKVFARNKGVGGIDVYKIKLSVDWQGYTYTDYFVFYSIPESGYENTFYWDVSNVPPRAYRYVAELQTLFDPDLSDNFYSGGVTFCPLPWDSSVTECYSECDDNCVDKFTGRYKAYCDGVNRCYFYNETFAKSCNGYTQGSYAPFNETHDALCPSADLIREKEYTNDTLKIESTCANGFFIERKPAFLRGESVTMDIVHCLD